MSGRTGKMTAEAIEERGPRFVLARRRDNGKMFYYSEGQENMVVQHSVVAVSYSKSYLSRLESANARP